MDFEAEEFTVVHDPSGSNEDDLVALVQSTGDEDGKLFAATIGAQAYTLGTESSLTPEERARVDMRTISSGDRVDLEEHVVSGKFTIFDYYADWCGPCKLLGADLEALVLERSDVAVRKIDIIDWESEAAKQATADYKLPGLPYIRVYGPDGKFLGKVEANDIAAIRALLGGQ